MPGFLNQADAARGTSIVFESLRSLAITKAAAVSRRVGGNMNFRFPVMKKFTIAQYVINTEHRLCRCRALIGDWSREPVLSRPSFTASSDTSAEASSLRAIHK